MDKWNNSIGRDIGNNATSSDDIARRVYNAMKRGNLIIDPLNDARRYDGNNPPGEGNNGGDTDDGTAVETGRTTPPRPDPPVPDLNGVLSGLNDSRQLKRGGWVNTGDGFLVWDDNHDGIINDISGTFSPYIYVRHHNQFRPDRDNGDRDDAICDDNNCIDDHCEDGHNDNRSPDTVIDLLDTVWNALRVWADIGHHDQSRVNGDDYDHPDSDEHRELNSTNESGINLLQLTTRDIALNEPRDGMHPDTSMRHGQAQIIYSIEFIHDELYVILTGPDSDTLWSVWLDDTAMNTATTWLSQRYWGIVNGPAALHDTNIIARLPDAAGEPVKLTYPDTIMPAQLSKDDVIDTGVQTRPVETIPQPLLTPHPFLVEGQSTAKQKPHSVNNAFRHLPMDNLVDSMAAGFIPPAAKQIRFASDWHTALTPVITAGWH